MRFDDEDDPKKPRPVHGSRKPLGSPETSEAFPWRHLKDNDRDRHRHVT